MTFFYWGTDRIIEQGHWVSFYVAEEHGDPHNGNEQEGCVDHIGPAPGRVTVTEFEDGSGRHWERNYDMLTFLGTSEEDAEARANGVRVVNGITLACDDIDALHEYAIDQVHNRGAEDLMVARILHAVRSATMGTGEGS